ncbi:MAG: tetratricopeptide repeat protein [Xanthobacteraceae bacterium]
MASILTRRIVAAALGAVVLTLPSTLSAQRAQRAPTQSEMPPWNEIVRVSPSGSYLAARHASVQRDASAASVYYRAALKADPRNSELLERAFLSVVADGDMDEAIKLAERLVAVDRNHRLARLVLGVRALKQKQYATAKTNLQQSVRGPITDLAGTLLAAWAQYGANDSKGAIEAIDKLQGAEWYALFKDLHAGMMLDLAGNKKEAGKRFERAYKLDNSALRLVEAYGSWLSRNGNRDEAVKVFQSFDAQLPRHPLIVDAMANVKSGKQILPLADTPQAGGAEVLYGLGAALGRRGGEDLGMVYLQLALYLAPNQPLALLALADLYEQIKNANLAIKFYERVPQTSPLRRNAEIQLAVNLDTLDRTDEAKKRLTKLIAEQPANTEAIMALGNIQRGRKEFSECADVYSKGVATISTPERPHWLIYYFRGICNERAKKWSAAESDLKTALKLYPDQPHVLNYLGYSWVDQGINLDEGMRMIRRAVEQRPDDGYIVDSLGWAYYRLGNYDEAVKHLERAVELKPDDPTINDHLGDGYWKTGRFLEAQFQWSHAKDLKPEPEDLEKIEQKLKAGLPEETSSAADASKQKKPGNGG